MRRQFFSSHGCNLLRFSPERVLSLGILLFNVTQVYPAEWLIETVDATGTVGNYNSLALDGFGNSHIAYYDKSNHDLKYARMTGTGWRIEVIDSETDVGRHATLCLDPMANPHIAYVAQIQNWHRTLRYTYWDGSAWRFESIDDQGHGHKVGDSASLAVDEYGHSHISFLDQEIGGTDNLRYAFRSAIGWQRSTVDDNGHSGRDSSLRLDNDMHPHISYLANGYWLHYAHWDGSVWEIEMLPSSICDGSGTYTSIALDADGNPHIIFCEYWFDNPSSIVMRLKYAYHDDSGWSVEFLTDVDCDVELPSMALDPHERLHVVYYNTDWTTGNRDLRIIWFDGSAWHTETVAEGISPDGYGFEMGETSIAINGDGSRHISFYDGDSQSLLYAFSPEPASTYQVECSTPADLTLRLIGPSPSWGRAWFRIGTPAPRPARLSVYDLCGKHIQLIHDGTLEEREYLVVWDGANDDGQLVPSGTYIISAEAGGQRVSKRIVMLR